MKKITIILIVLCTIILGVLYKAPAQLANLKQRTTCAAGMDPFNYETPNAVIDPMIAVPLIP